MSDNQNDIRPAADQESTTIAVHERPKEARMADVGKLIDSIIDPESAARGLRQIHAVEEMLRAADQYGEYASKYAVAEAKMWLRICEIDGTEQTLTESQQHLKEWLKSKDDYEREDIMAQCSDGIRIRVIMRRELGSVAAMKRRDSEIEEHKRLSRQIVDRLETTGMTKLSTGEYYRMWKNASKPDAAAVRASIEETKNKLLAAGGIGLGDGSGTYVMPSECSKDELLLAIRNRLESIVNDLKSIKAICDETGFIIPDSGIAIVCDLIRSCGGSAGA